MRAVKMSLIGRAVVGGMLALTASVQAQRVKEEWVARYNGPGNDHDSARAMAIDDSGNVYVTGSSYGDGERGYRERDYATIKYDPAGNQLWVARYNGALDVSDYAEAIAVDARGNVYVTGVSDGDNCATIKYDTEGNELWVAKSRSFSPNALAVDTSGNVYVTGAADGGGRPGYITIKYDPAGKMLWKGTHRGSAKRRDWSRAIAVDGAGNVYVTGASWYKDTGLDYTTIKYDPAGNELWAVRYNGPQNAEDQAVALAIDGSGRVCVTGLSSGNGGSYDYATVTYDAKGVQLWVSRYDGPRGQRDGANTVRIDGLGNVYVTGWSDCTDMENATCNFATIKYDPEGDEIWVATYNGPNNGDDKARDMAVDASGNVYVTGSSDCTTPGNATCNYATVKYSPEGEQRWVARYKGPAELSDYAFALAIDNSGGVYVTGLTDYKYKSDEFQGDYATIKYSQASGGCTGREKLKARCKDKNGASLAIAKATRGTPGDTVEFCLDDEKCKERTINDAGNAKAKWKRSAPGKHVVTAEWICGASKKRNIDCPKP